MEALANHPFNDPGSRFALDNLIDGLKDDSLVIWEALDTGNSEPVWIIGRKVKELADSSLNVLPCAMLLGNSLAAIGRYAPARPGGGWDYSKIAHRSRVIIP